MYTRFFGLTEKPFAITPDPRYLYLSERHAEALAHLLYGVNESGGFIQLTGEVGTGKTTVVRTLLSRIPQHADVAVIMNPRISSLEFLLTICEELGVSIAESDHESVKGLVDALNRRLLSAHAEGRRVIVIVDEAQNLSAEVLEQVRLLTNLETSTHKLLQIILIGQPELRELLDRNDLRQLAQRITGRYHLQPLSAEETQGYVRHRLRVAGVSDEIFSKPALAEVHRVSRGIPRVINVCCDRALLGAFTRETHQVTASLIRTAASEVYGRRIMPAWVVGLSIAGILAAACTALVAWQFLAHSPTITHLANSVPGIAGRQVSPSSPTAPALQPKQLALKPTPSINSLLISHRSQTDDAAAYRRLLSLWGAAMTDDRNPCAQANKAGLACLDQQGSWAQVKILNRPAILTLIDNQGEKHRVVLTHLDDKTATLIFGEHDEQVPLEELSNIWFGEFAVIWKPKSAHVRVLALGMRNDQVRWLRRSLSALQGLAADPEKGDLYDPVLVEAVRNFQRAYRLAVDGIAGVQTQVVLDAILAEPGSPLLIANAPHSG